MDCAPQVVLAGVQAVMVQVLVVMSVTVFPEDDTPVPWIGADAAHVKPGAMLFLIETKLRFVEPFAGRLCTRMPPQL